jgi:hypothetical protein
MKQIHPSSDKIDHKDEVADLSKLRKQLLLVL